MATSAQTAHDTLSISSYQEVLCIYSGTQVVGQAFDPISGDVGFTYVTNQNGQPEPLQPPTTINQNAQKLVFVDSTSTYESLSGVNASANVAFNGLVFAGSGSIEANFSTQSQINEGSIAMVAMATNIATSQMINPNDSTIDVTEAVNEITTNGYDAFCANNGTHFVAGFFYGNFYMASYTSFFSSDTDAQNAAVNVNTQANDAVASGSITAGYTSAVSQQQGYQSSRAEFQSLGSANTSGSTTPDGINAALAAFPPAVTTSPIYIIALDWRMIPAIHNIKGLTTSVNYTAYYNNIPLVQQTLAGLQLGLQTANKTVGIGTANINQLAGIVQELTSQIAQIQALTPLQVANFNALNYNNYLTTLDNFPGGATIVINLALDSTFGLSPLNQSGPPLTYSGPVIPRDVVNTQTFITYTKQTGQPAPNQTEPWAFGCYYSAAGVVYLAFGLRTADQSWDPSGNWTNIGPGNVFQYNPNGSNSFTIYGVGPNANTPQATYPWLRCTVTIAPYPANP